MQRISALRGTRRCLERIAEAYRQRGDYRSAIPAQRERMEIQERELGPEHPATLTSVNNLAALFKACQVAHRVIR